MLTTLSQQHTAFLEQQASTAWSRSEKLGTTKMVFRSTAQVHRCWSFCFLVLIWSDAICFSLHIHPHPGHSNSDPSANLNKKPSSSLFSKPRLNYQAKRSHADEKRTTGKTRRNLLLESIASTPIILSSLGFPKAAFATSSNGVVTVRLNSPEESLGVEIYDTTLRGNNVVAIRKIVVPNKNNQFLMEGMVLRSRDGGSYTAKDLVQRLRLGPYPLEVDFVNLAAGGDAISDMGTSIVTPKDALELAQKTEDSPSNAQQTQRGGGYSITTLQQTQQPCAIRSRRNDVLEIEYEASYIVEDGGKNKKVLYDASAFRGTGNRPYQMVLGSGDMIPGVDQGLYDMCPGDKRLLSIPPLLGHGPNSRKLYRIPDNYKNLEWEVSLVTIDSTIKEDNNDVSREDRESRFAY